MRGDSYPARAAATPVDPWEDAHLAGQDLHGTAAVMGYYRALVLDDLQRLMKLQGITPQANPKNCWFDSTPYKSAADLNVALSSWVAPAGCTGFEQMLTPAFPTTANTWTDSLDMTPQHYHVNTVFRPGDPLIDFMADPVNAVGEDAFNGGDRDLVQSSLNQVIAVLGHGNVLNACRPMRKDWRYYFQLWAKAFTKYLLNRSKNPTWQQLYADDQATAKTLKQINMDQLFFDLQNGLDRFEYIDRTSAQQLGGARRLQLRHAQHEQHAGQQLLPAPDARGVGALHLDVDG